MLRRFKGWLNWLAPRVCPACEGGSGWLRDDSAEQFTLCDRCTGTGREK